jgi:hypothetical protein
MIKYVIRRNSMIKQNESTLPRLRVKPSRRKGDTATRFHRAATTSPKRGVFVTEKGPTFLKMYAIPMLLLDLAVVGWTLVTRTLIAQGIMIYLGYALLVAVGLRLYLVYLDHSLFSARSVQSGRKVPLSTRDRDQHESERWQDARRTSAEHGPERRQPGQRRAEVFI